VRGFNVTTPHKTTITSHLDKIERQAAQIQSVNTVTNERGKLIGLNTDGVGALNSLREAGATPEGQAVLLVGAGGAGRAIAYALAEQGCGFTLMNRTLLKARRLANQVQEQFGVKVTTTPLSTRSLRALLGEMQVVINASTMGMNGKSDLPIKPTWIRPEHYVFELVYRPLQTRLLQYASLAGAKTITGLDMLVNQGACAFSLWTGKKAPMLEMRQAIAQRLPAVGAAAG
jgi:shikimate dehydrogenase